MLSNSWKDLATLLKQTFKEVETQMKKQACKELWEKVVRGLKVETQRSTV